MKILVFSDSHRALSFMRLCIEKIRPDAMIHLGDHYADGENIHLEYPEIRFYQVPGNCDMYSAPPFAREMLIQRLGGVDFYLTHGHIHRVKQSLFDLLRNARACKCQAALYGHTHIPDCYQEEDGLWVLNPGAAQYSRGTAGLIEVKDQKITSCRIITGRELEEML